MRPERRRWRAAVHRRAGRREVLGVAPEATRLGPDLHDRDRRRVVDQDRRRRQASRRRVDLVFPVGVLQEAAADLRRVDARLAGQHALHQFVLRHLQREEQAGDVVLQRRVHGDVHRPGGLAAAGAGGDDDQVLALQARRELVELGEPRRHAGHGLSFGGAHLQVVQHLLHQVAGGRIGLAAVLLGDLEDLGLRLVEEGLELAEVAVGGRLHLGAGGDEPPQRRLLAHQARVVQRRSPPWGRRWPARSGTTRPPRGAPACRASSARRRPRCSPAPAGACRWPASPRRSRGGPAGRSRRPPGWCRPRRTPSA